MSDKIRKGFSKSIDWTVTHDKKRTKELSESAKTIAKELDKNPIPSKEEDSKKKS